MYKPVGWESAFCLSVWVLKALDEILPYSMFTKATNQEMPRSDLQWDVSVRLQQLIRQSGQGKWCNKGEGHLTLCKLDVKRLPTGQRTGKVVGVFFYTPDCEMLSVFCFVFNLRYLFLLKSLESISDAHAISVWFTKNRTKPVSLQIYFNTSGPQTHIIAGRHCEKQNVILGLF